jgi:glycosyltransferase involved in cell wall biosynthesis
MVEKIYVIDDRCPEHTADVVETHCKDPRVVIIRHILNQGVGGAVVSGYERATQDRMDIVVKLDGDGQMNPKLIPLFVQPIQKGRADYTKGNRFWKLESLERMPRERLFGNSCLSLITKIVTGYWSVMDPTNGYTAIHVSVLKNLPLTKLEKRYFFETDMLFRLGNIRAAVLDIPMDAVYDDETSSLVIGNIIRQFPPKYLERFLKRIFYNYFLRDFNAGSLQLLAGLALSLFGFSYGAFHWIRNSLADMGTPPGTVMMAAFPALVGIQFLLAVLQYDVANAPRSPIHPELAERDLSQTPSLPSRPRGL